MKTRTKKGLWLLIFKALKWKERTNTWKKPLHDRPIDRFYLLFVCMMILFVPFRRINSIQYTLVGALVHCLPFRKDNSTKMNLWKAILFPFYRFGPVLHLILVFCLHVWCEVFMNLNCRFSELKYLDFQSFCS